MTSGNNISISGECPPPAGKYTIAISGSGDCIVVVTSDFKEEFRTDQVDVVGVSWAVPARSGGYICLSLCLKAGAEKVLFMSEGYDADVLEEYCRIGSELARALKVEFKEMSLGADA